MVIESLLDDLLSSSFNFLNSGSLSFSRILGSRTWVLCISSLTSSSLLSFGSLASFSAFKAAFFAFLGKSMKFYFTFSSIFLMISLLTVSCWSVVMFKETMSSLLKGLLQSMHLFFSTFLVSLNNFSL